MAENVLHGVDSEQVKKAIKALFADHKSKNSANSLLLNEHDRISLMLTVWKIPSQAKTIRIPLPHGIRPDTCDVCLFTRDEPNMSVEQTEKFYRKLLSKHGLKQITEIIPLKKMKKEYKPFEAKRRLLSSFDMFLADERIRRLLPSLIGKHFYKAKREPLSVKLKGKNLAAVLKRSIQGTLFHITNKGCCYEIRVGHTGMEVGDIVENVLAVAQTIAEKLPKKWKNVKVLHLKTQSSAALPIYTSSFDNLKELILVKPENVKTKKPKSSKEGKPVMPASDGTENQLADTKKDSATLPKKQKKLPKNLATPPKKQKTLHKDSVSPLKKKKLHKDSATPPKKQKLHKVEEEEEIPQLVPIQEPSTAKKSKKKRNNVQEKPKVEAKSTSSEEAVQVSPTEKITLLKRKLNESENVVKTPIKLKKELPSEGKTKEPQKPATPPRRSILKKTPKKTGVQEEPKVEEKGKSSEEDVQVSPTEKPTLPKMNESENAVKTPIELKNELPSEGETKKPEKLETPPRRSILKKTPKKTGVQEEPKVEEKGKSSEEDVQVSPTEKPTLPKMNESENAVKTPIELKNELPSEGETKKPEKLETPPRRSILKKTAKKKDVQEEPKVEGKSKSSEEDVQVSPTGKRTLRKRKVNESGTAVKTPIKNKKHLLSEGKTKEPEKSETPPRPSILKKSPKKTPSKTVVKERSAKKAQTPKLKQKKKMSTPPTV